ncbi:MAG: P63C domain-containing protein [Candidatus Sumerlaeota bacterium]|nr:P63C domain-containing protein [Candidatus Sumerlaeota bacterium]
MNAAQKVIAKFGGQSKLADLLGKRQSVVQYWTKSGTIPSKWYQPILELAQSSGVNLSLSDFLQMPEKTDAAYSIPDAKWWGKLQIGEGELPCYVLDDGRRVISRTGATDLLTDRRGGGNLESYIQTGAIRSYISPTISDQMIEFTIQGVVNKSVRGIEADVFLELCRAYVKAFGEGALKTDSQVAMALRAMGFLAACAKVGLVALIDEATGYQYERAQDALRFKLKAYLEEEMRKWEKTFPDELWQEFGRLTNWEGSVTQRPKYWGKLVMELVYEYLDPDVAAWLRENAPDPRHGRNYHQWLSSQYGLKRLVEHIWMLVGMAKSCYSMRELREKMAEQFGREPYQLTMFIPTTTALNPRTITQEKPRGGKQESSV